MNTFAGISAFAIIAISAPAYAGEVVLYEDVPAWVDVAEIDMSSVADGPSEVLVDWQYRLEGGTVHEYHDRIVRIDNLQALTSEGTLKMTWAPDKGDLFVHRLEIIRGDEVIDLIAEGTEFEILRREQGLERRLLDGRLTATLAVPKLQEDDLLRVAHTITIDDQALGDEMQALQYLPSEPYRVGQSRVVMSWPKDSGITYQAGPDVEVPDLEVRDGFEYLTIDLPLAKREDFPGDAPSRFRRAPILRAGSFDSWQELSQVMEPHFTAAAELSDDGAVASEAKAIMAKTDDPLKRTELAVRMVQDQVSYLLDGLDGGNYLPQSAEDTWEKRYGDCKAKSVLLLALLQYMGIESDVVLVATRGGDATPELLPLPASFDHMIVRANVNGTDYWLDGTTTATRITNMDTVPAFHYALPLKPGGAGLVPMTDRPMSSANVVIKLEADHSAGVDLPALISVEMQMFGAAGAQFKAIVDEGDPETEKRWRNMSGGSMGIGQISSVEFAYDDELAMGSIKMEGVSQPMFDYDKGELTMEADGIGRQRAFSPNRARPKWKNIPVATRGPSRSIMMNSVLLPGNADDYTINGDQSLDQGYANTRVIRNASLEDGRFTFEQQQVNGLGEIAPEDIPAARLASLKLTKADLTVDAPTNSVRRWERDRAALDTLTASARKRYDMAVAEADDDEFGPLQSRAQFFNTIYDFDNAQKDLGVIIAEEPTADLLMSRADMYEALGRIDDAIADIRAAYELSPENYIAYAEARLLRQTGRADEALALIEALPIGEEDLDDFASERAYAMAMGGDLDGGLALLAERIEEEPDSGSLLNDACWYRGIFNVSLDDAMAICTKAIERAGNPASAIDSRAMIHYRLGELDQALADLDSALKLNPELSASRFMRGIVMQAQGNNADGAEQIRQALLKWPYLEQHYKLYGIEPQ
ncbi:tetratricopeptide repeat protein [Pontixanthobacter aestiaquae]|uniref:Tetratricopeptide repeat protein n=1 Tax=Pontixanthobacter aestiaquae TaxID=1509367 RepID=A0A844Z9Z9_9SPHN|nr:DUF3857 domain-containing protein [Pontixanthobacter aestiaquae]MDN3645143.1 tetratricopeptide repeat protein [Pontixanthobacter aestiaquae]MXO83857.1 tetratricopeptide repeat protein [Pontixanthobacter aestiaquae]